MVAWQMMLALVCLAIVPTMAQITFSRSWVPQGKRSGPLVSPAGAPSLDVDPCRDTRLSTLTDVASHLVELMDDVSDLTQDDAALALRLKHALLARQRRLT
ncbi:uncharacterized protein [Procambarus clarkii]|uniref:uncharacterized protein n=1 Tax=Procambarus clarkii TaxID=6728 RepID=UPI001E6724F2|nr:uncharacterized protein LOC123757346 [Procambarus clarkii]